MKHQVTDQISLEFARRVADGLVSHPEWIDLARENLARWEQRNADAPGLIRCYREWREILTRPIDEVRAILTMQNDEGQRLRSNTPFAGVLTPREVWAIKQRIWDEAKSDIA